jgi:hypothetical protein
MKKDIIFYSNFCTYCKEIINQISKTPINDNILYVCVDDDNIQLPNFIKAVPTIYLVSQKRIVVDDSIPKWIEEKLSKSESQNDGGELQAYFGQCDSSYGSSFSNLDNSEQKPYISSSFTFIGEEQKITTPEESSSNNNNSMQNNSFMKDGLSNDYEKLQNSRSNEFQPLNRR